MSKNNGREVAKRLTQEIAVTTDPETLIRLTRQLAKFQPKNRKSKSKVAEKPKKTTITQPGRLSKRVKTGSAMDELSDAQWLFHDAVITIEKLRRQYKKSGRELTDDEKAATTAEVIGTMTAEELAAIKALPQ